MILDFKWYTGDVDPINLFKSVMGPERFSGFD